MSQVEEECFMTCATCNLDYLEGEECRQCGYYEGRTLEYCSRCSEEWTDEDGVVHEPDNNISSCEVCGVCEDCEHLAECTKGTNNL
jgi:hypothetical protein